MCIYIYIYRERGIYYDTLRQHYIIRYYDVLHYAEYRCLQYCLVSVNIHISSYAGAQDERAQACSGTTEPSPPTGKTTSTPVEEEDLPHVSTRIRSYAVAPCCYTVP